MLLVPGNHTLHFHRPERCVCARWFAYSHYRSPARYYSLLVRTATIHLLPNTTNHCQYAPRHPYWPATVRQNDVGMLFR